jgi:hypothetical protein
LGVSGLIPGGAAPSAKELEGGSPNLIAGDDVGGIRHLDQFFLFHPITGWSRPHLRRIKAGEPRWTP